MYIGNGDSFEAEMGESGFAESRLDGLSKRASTAAGRKLPSM